MTQLGPTFNSSVPSSHALTVLHLAVLADDFATVRKIIGDREHGVDERTATGTTSVMLAALYGRTNIFLYLTLKKASRTNKDFKGNNALDYVRQASPFVRDLIRDYKNIAVSNPDRAGRRLIYGVLKARERDSRVAFDRGRSQRQPPADTEQAGPQQRLQDPSMGPVFLRSLDGKHQAFVETRLVALAQHSKIGRKCTGFIRSSDENSGPMFSISGWGSARDKDAAYKNVLDGREYTELVRRVAAVLDFELKANWLDCRFFGNASEKKGAFVACHSEKQLAVFVLVKALSHALGTKALTVSNFTSLKTLLHKLPPGLRDTTIHLDHKLVCGSCVQFLELLTQKTGLIFRCESRDWYIYGERPQLRPGPNGRYKQVTEETRRPGPHDGTDVIDDEIGLFGTDGIMETDLQSDSVNQKGSSLPVEGDSVPPSTSSNGRASLKQHLALRVPSDFEKRGSPVYEEPKEHFPRYAVPSIIPPSGNAQALPNPKSYTRGTELPRITIYPSPVGRSSTSGPENQARNMSPSTHTVSPEYEVEEIMQSVKYNDETMYLVKWKGYPHDDNTWESENNLVNAPGAISKFWEELHAAQSHSQAPDA